MSFSPDLAPPLPLILPAAPPTFEHMVLPHRDAAHNLARYLLRHDQDAEDCVQEACFRAFRAFKQFRGTDAKGWFLVIVRNTCYLHLRRRRRRGFPVPFDEILHSEPVMPGASAPVESDSLAQGLLPKALERLPAEARMILVLREIEGLAYKEIRTRMHIPMGTVMSRLSRARIRLQREVRELVKKTARFDCTSTFPAARPLVRANMAA
jgi:RNA polymerase sigma-70 factor (ECF subfamily)